MFDFQVRLGPVALSPVPVLSPHCSFPAPIDTCNTV